MLGTATSTLGQAPVNDPSWEIWACSSFFTRKLSRFDRFFELHYAGQFNAQETSEYLPWLAGSGKPVYTFDQSLPLPNAVAYPRAEIVAQFGTWFLTSTIAWMAALAVHEQVSDIGIWGVDMATDTEYAEQKAGCLFFIQLARMAGVNIHIPKGSELLNGAKPYPDNYLDGPETKLRQYRTETEQAIQAARDEQMRLTGALDAIKALQRTI